MLVIAFWQLTGLAEIYDPVWMIAGYKVSTLAFWAYYVLGILTGILTVVLALALQERMQAEAPNLMRLAVIAASAYSALFITTMIGGFFRNILLTGMSDMSAFRTFLVQHEFLGNAAISILGWAFLMIGCAALRTRALPWTLGFVILAYGIVSIVQFAFAVSKVHAGFALDAVLGLVVFVWLGVALLRNPEPIPART